ncbi:uncharacterized protein LOC134257611 [Saccostrea cucullata]|uniref:uncharacterized protein LOC134257611 n=1 Tax=Saccostrea cuccullata TaxID=36930 RepID=UPI002ED4626B
MAEVKQSKNDKLQLSSAVASLEVFRMNVINNVLDKSKKVGFSASVSSSSSSWNSGTLVFPSVITNAGNGYNPSTGIFTAPITGMYVFFVNVQGHGAKTIFVDIVLNGSTKVRTMAYSTGNDYDDAGPNLVVLTIQKGDAVWVKHYYGAGPSVTHDLGFIQTHQNDLESNPRPKGPTPYIATLRVDTLNTAGDVKLKKRKSRVKDTIGN